MFAGIGKGFVRQFFTQQGADMLPLFRRFQGPVVHRLTKRALVKNYQTNLGHHRSTPPVRFSTSAVTFFATASICASVSVASTG